MLNFFTSMPYDQQVSAVMLGVVALFGLMVGAAWLYVRLTWKD